MALLFLCPNCGNRSSTADQTAGFRTQPKGCQKCKFGFLIELMDDYYPAPNAAFFACDQEGRIVACGRGSFELTGLKDDTAIGRPAAEVLGLRFDDTPDPVTTALEWGVRQFGKDVQVGAKGHHASAAKAKADVLPAYDEDGGLLLVLTPTA